MFPPIGSRVHVTWTDGRIYGGTLCAFAQGLAQVRFDTGGAPAWVPLASLVQQAPVVHAAAPAPAWNPYPVNVNVPAPVPAPAPPAPAAVTPAPAAPAAQPVQATAPSAGTFPPLPSLPPPRPMSSTIGALPRGLIFDPTGPACGKSFFVFFGFLATADVDLAMRMTDIEHLGDDVAALRAAGFRVVVDLHGNLEGLNAALSGTHPDAQGTVPVGVFWGGHGEDDGAIGDFEGGFIDPEHIAPEVAAKGTLKLFVMSACYAGNHAGRWQKALGPNAQIIGWGAPITNERAIEFLTPDEASSKGFDDLLARHLGVKRVCTDGPLADARDLSRKHEDRIATLNLTFDELVDGATKKLKCPMTRGKGGEAYFTVKTPGSKDSPDRPRSQGVRAQALGVGGSWICISSLVGPYSDALDLARGIRLVTPSLHVRIALAKVTPPDSEFVIVETLFRRRRLDPVTFANNVMTIGRYADKLEDLFFGSDQR